MNATRSKDRVDFVVLNDLHPEEYPGAATIAFEIAQKLSECFLTEYWCATSKGYSGPGTKSKYLKIIKIRYRKRAIAIFYKFNLTKLFHELFNPVAYIWFVTKLLKTRPRILWMHQIGGVFPWFIVWFAKALKVTTVLTLHDFTLVYPGKVYPKDVGTESFEIDDYCNTTRVKEAINESQGTSRVFKRFFRIRRCLLRRTINKVDLVIAISELQSNILIGFGFKKLKIINNGVLPCNCKATKEVRIKNSKPKILFAGRAIGKGLERISYAVAKTKCTVLVLAGPPELVTIASRVLPRSRIEYLGQLTRNNMFREIHKVQAVAVLSDCLDVFPTMTLEALAHGALVLTTPNTGNSFYSRFTSQAISISSSKTEKLLISVLDQLENAGTENFLDEQFCSSLRTPSVVLEEVLVELRRFFSN